MEIRDAVPERGDGRGWIVCVRCDNTQTIMGNRSKVDEAIVVGVLCLWGAEGTCFQPLRPLFVVRTSARHRRRFSTGQPIVTTKNCEGEAK